ncbi:MAG: hypothetical protein QME58_12100 [Bacteroidota bacterium]|nr:hypothetical protein [Bacteroidota bacterium]
MKKYLLIIISMLLLLQVHTMSQETKNEQQIEKKKEKVQRIILNDGSELVGFIEYDHGDSVRFNTFSGLTITIPKNQISSIDKLAGEIINGEYYRMDPNNTRLFFAPTARTIRSGHGYFSAYEIFFPMLAFGIADVVSIAGGMSLFPGAPLQIFYVAPKITPIHTDDLDIAGGVLYLNSTLGGFEGLGIVYGVGTYGNEKAAFTGGLGWGFSRGELTNKPILLLGGELRLSNSLKLISENWIPPDADIQFISFGLRFFGDKVAGDFGLIHPLGSRIENFPFIPWIGFAYNF